MNLLIITAMFPPIRTGSSFYAEDLARSLSKRGHKVIVTTLKNNRVIKDEYDFDVHRLSAIHLENLFKNHFKHFRISSFFLTNIVRVNRIIREDKIDAILLISHYHDISFVAVAASQINKTPLFTTVNTQIQSTKYYTQKIMTLFDRIICGKFILPFCDNIISLDSEIEAYIKNTYNKKTEKKLVLIPYGVHGNVNTCYNYSRDYNLKNQLIGIGAVIEQRNFEVTIKIFNEVVKTLPQMRLKIIGHVYQAKTRELVTKLGLEKKVIFTGEQPHEVILQELRDSDVYMGIFSGKYVGLGTATIEAMLMGVPIVSNAPGDLFGSASLVDMENYVFANSVEEGKDKMLRLLGDDSLRAKVGTMGCEFVSEYMNWDMIGEKFEDLFYNYIGDDYGK